MSARLVLRSHPRAAEIVALRARLFAGLRRHLDGAGLLEVDVPVLLPFAGTEPHLQPPRVHVDGLPGPLWLQTSPELPCKRLLCAGVTRLYSLSHVFRGGRDELSTHHRPEFTMLEWYRPGVSIDDLVDDVLGLGRAAAEALGVAAPASSRVITIREACRLFADLDATPLLAGDARSFARAARAAGLAGCRDDDPGATLLGRVLVERIEPALRREPGWVFLHGYPADQAAMAKLSDDAVPTAQRVEAYLGGVEIANGYVELGDADELRARWQHEARERTGEPVPHDDDLLLALAEGSLGDCVGMALGVDRLALGLLGARDLRDVLPLALELDDDA